MRGSVTEVAGATNVAGQQERTRVNVLTGHGAARLEKSNQGNPAGLFLLAAESLVQCLAGQAEEQRRSPLIAA